MTDPIADLITRIRNAYLAKNRQIIVPHSKIKAKIVALLTQEGYFNGYQVKKSKPQAQIIIELKYINHQPAVTSIQRISKPGRRIYLQAKEIKPILAQYGTALISTNQGILSHLEAKKKRLGGEYLLKVY